MDAMKLWNNVYEIAQNQTPNRVIFGILQLKHQIDRALEEGMSQELIEKTVRDALNTSGKIYL